MDLSVYQIIWIVSGSLLVIGWLIVSFARPSRSRLVVEWLSATAMYVAILTIFVRITLNAHADGKVFATWAIGLLCVLFGGGLLVSAWKALAALGSEKTGPTSQTH